MRNAKRKTMICAVAAIAAISCGAAFSMTVSASAASAENEYFASAKFVMREGASVRYYTGSSESETKKNCGLRFSATLDKETYLALESLETADSEGSESVGNTSVSYGMLIAPYSAVQEHDLTAATVFGFGDESGKVYTWEEENAEGKIPVLNITYNDLLPMKDSEEFYEINGSIVDLKERNYTREFVGRAYIRYEKDGVAEYTFADYAGGNVTNNARSATYVAQKAQESDKESTAAKKWVKTAYIEGLAEEYKDTTYTVNTYVNGDLEQSEDKSAKIGGTTPEASVYQGFTFDEANSSKRQSVVYANGKTVLNMYYTADDASESNRTQIADGGFEKGGLGENWTMQGNIGGVSSETHYFKNDELSAKGFPFGLDGTYMFSAFVRSSGDEKVGWLKSSDFTVSENGWLTFKMGGGGDNRLLYIDVIESGTGKVLKRFANQNFTKETENNVKPGCRLNAYKANLKDLAGKTVYLRVTDGDAGGSTKEYGTIFLDSFNAMHIGEPSDAFALATDLLTVSDYNANALYNGTFDEGLAGWKMEGEIGEVNAYSTFWAEKKPFNNNGNFFSAYGYRKNDDGVEEMPSYEGNTGTLQSSPFVLGGNGAITFGIGGMKNSDQVFMEIRDWETDKVYGKYYNENINDCALVSYVVDLSEYTGRTVYIKFTDNAVSDYGLLFADDIITYYENVPTAKSFCFAKNLVYNTFVNGGFERGSDGWKLENGDGSAYVSASTYWAGDQNFWWRAKTSDSESDEVVTVQRFEKDGNNFYMSGDASTGTLTSDAFKVGGDGILTFKLGGNKENVRVEIYRADTNEVVSTVINEQFNDPLCAQTMLRRYVDLSAYIGQDVYVKIVDNKEGGIGFATFDSMMLLTKSEAKMIFDRDKAYYATYFDELMSNTEATLPGTGNRAKEIVQTIKNYYANLILPF